MPFKFDQVSYTEDCQALYLDGELLFSGDEYHDSIGVSIEEYINGFKKALEYCNIKADVKENWHTPSDDMQTKFTNDGYDYPERFPNGYAGEDE